MIDLKKLSEHSYFELIVSVFAWISGYFLCTILFPYVPFIGKYKSFATFLSFGILLLITIPVLSYFINLRTKWYYLLIIFPTAFESVIFLNLLLGDQTITNLFSDILIVIYSYCLAKLFGKQIKKTSILLVILIIISIADLISVFMGPARIIYNSSWSKFLMLNFPVIGTSDTVWMLGFGDIFIFILLCGYCVKTRNMNYSKNLKALGATLFIPAIISSMLNTIIPALPFMCLVFYLINDEIRNVKLNSSEIKFLIFGLSINIILAVTFSFI